MENRDFFLPLSGKNGPEVSIEWKIAIFSSIEWKRGNWPQKAQKTHKIEIEAIAYKLLSSARARWIIAYKLLS